MNPELPIPASRPEIGRFRRPRPDTRPRLHLQVPDPSADAADHFTVPVLHVRRAIVHSFALGIYDSRTIASRLADEMASKPGGRPVRVDPEWVREIRRKDRSAIESDLAGVLAGRSCVAARSPVTPGRKFGAIYCLHAARERMRLAAWVDRLRLNPAAGESKSSALHNAF